MDFTTNINQTMDIDVDFGNQSCQPTRMLSMFVGNNQTFNFEDTEITFEFTRYIQQLCNEMEEAKNRIDGCDSDAIKNLLEAMIDKIHQDISIVNNSINASLNTSLVNQTVLNNTTAVSKNDTATKTPTNSNSKAETSILGLLADLFRENKEEKNPIENISKLNILSRSLKDLSASLSANLSMNNTNTNERSILKSIREEGDSNENKENATNTTIQDMTIAEATFINKSVCSPLMELLSAVEKKIDIERIEEELKVKYEKQLKEKDDIIIKLEQDLICLKERCKNHDITLEQLQRQKKENEVLDEIISDEKRKLEEKQSTIEELNVRISENMNQILNAEEKNIELKKEVNRLSVVEKENQSLNEQVNELLNKVNKMFDLEKKMTILTVECNEKQVRIDNVSYELKTNQDLLERLSKEKNDLMNRIDVLIKEDSDKAILIQELNTETMNLKARLSLQNDKCDFLSAKLKDTNNLKSQLERDRKDVCWQINELLKNPDIDFDDLKRFLILVEEKINNVDFKKPKGAAFVKSLASSSVVKESAS